MALDALNVDPTGGTGGSGDPHGTGGTGGSGDPVQGVPAHHELLGNDRLVVENLTNLDAIPDRFTLSVFPLDIARGDRSPVRAVARWD